MSESIKSVTWSVLIMTLLSVSKPQVVPSSYITIDAQIVSMSGSSDIGHCLSVSGNEAGTTSTCTDPTSSVLFDGVIPTLTGLDGDMWASQLLTLQSGFSATTRPRVLFDFTDTQGYVGLSGRLEVTMFYCPVRENSASIITVSTSSSPSGSTTPLIVVKIDNTSCDTYSLVRVGTSITTTQPSITLEFATSGLVYLAEVAFLTSPPDTIITTAPPDTMIVTGVEITTNRTKVTPPPPPPNTTTAMGSDITSVIVPVVVVICVVFMIVGIMAAVLILWRYHKHKTSHHTALGEGHSHAHTHSHPPPVKMCEETGQVCYSSPPEALGQLSPSHDTYSHIQRDISEGRREVQSHQWGSGEEGEYSTLSHGNSPHVLGGGGEDSASQLYAQVDKKAKKKNKGSATEMSTLATYSSLDKERSGVHTSETDTAIDQLYSQVDKKKKKVEVYIAAHPHTPVPNADIDQLYSQVDKKKKGEVAGHLHTPADIDQLYSQVDKKVKKKKREVAAHPQTTEAHTPMDQLYAQVDKKKKSS